MHNNVEFISFRIQNMLLRRLDDPEAGESNVTAVPDDWHSGLSDEVHALETQVNDHIVIT